MKGIEDTVEIFELGMRDGSPFLPPADADKAYRVVRNGDLWSPVREVRHNLPAERDTFVGRGVELRVVGGAARPRPRLVTVLGPGGTGKTRLVAATASPGSATGPAASIFAISPRHARSKASTLPSPRRWRCRWATTTRRCSSATQSPAAGAAS